MVDFPLIKGSTNTGWEYAKRFKNMLNEGQPPPWYALKGFMIQKYMLERYTHKLLTKLYNLRQGNKSVLTYYNEFQQLS